MNTNHAIVTLILLSVAFSVPAQEPDTTTTLPGVKAQAILHVFACERRTLPSQRLVGEWTGQYNFAQVYATRARLMGDVARACNKPGAEHVNLVLQRPPAGITNQQPRWVAAAEPSGR